MYFSLRACFMFCVVVKIWQILLLICNLCTVLILVLILESYILVLALVFGLLDTRLSPTITFSYFKWRLFQSLSATFFHTSGLCFFVFHMFLLFSVTFIFFDGLIHNVNCLVANILFQWFIDIHYAVSVSLSSSVLWRRWLADRNGIQPVTISLQQSPKVLLQKTCGDPT